MPPSRTDRPGSATVGVESVVVVQTIVPHYRVPFFDLLRDQLGDALTVVAGEADWSQDMRAETQILDVVVANRFLAGRRLLWQSGVMRRTLGARTVVFVLNPRILSAWVVLAVRRVRGRRTVLWGHAWPRGGRGSSSDIVRHAMRRLAHGLVVYTDEEALEVGGERADPGSVVAAPNSLYTQQELEEVPRSTHVTDVVVVGRLNAEKKPFLALEAFSAAGSQLAEDVRLVFVGDGPARERLESTIADLGLSSRVVVRGHVTSVDELREIYARAIVSVSPGPAGLTLVQSLGFGVPALVSDHELHGPEIALAVEDENTRYFERDSVSSLASKLAEFADERELWLSRREDIARPIHERHCIESMVAGFMRALA
jgi:glycosyltransferase involved in cell wall biosynthesis